MSLGARSLLVGAALFVAFLHAGSSRADQGDPAAAEALFREGRAAADAGDHEKACKKFRESNRLDAAPGTVFNIAACEEKLGHLATAWTLFREVAQRLPSQDERSTIASSRAAALELRLPKLSLSLAHGAPPGSRVFRDGVELQAGALDTALPVDPGKHAIAVEAPGYERAERIIELREGETKRETMQPGKAAPEGHAQGSRGSSTRRTIGYVVGGVGLVGLGVGTVTGVMVLGKKSTVDDNCDEEKRCNQAGADAAESGRTLGAISGVSFIVGAVGIGVGTVLFLSSGGESEGPKSALVLGPGRVGFQARF